ncbi:MAG: hypothetical protein IK138_02880 [Lachnospiraceae bacterium]|nr:hypothetical protein [Lachnospiraceae bacterium]
MDFDYWKSKALEENPSLREAEPAKVEAKADEYDMRMPISDDAVLTEPVVTDPVLDGSLVTEPVVTDPVLDGSLVTEPVVTKPVVTELFADEPVTDSPVIVEPISAEPITSEPVEPAPVINTPVTTELVNSAPVNTAPVSSGVSLDNNNVILNEGVNEAKEPGKAGRICKAIFLGVPFGIPIFIVMLAVLSAAVAAMCVVFGILVMGCTALCAGGLALILLGIANVQNSLGASFLLMGGGVLGCGLGFLLILLTRVVFKYLLLGLFRCYVLPVRFIKLFFCKKATPAESAVDSQTYEWYDPSATETVQTDNVPSDTIETDNNAYVEEVEIFADDSLTEDVGKPKRFLKTFSILACVLTVLGVGIMLTTFFVFYSDDIPSKLQQNHKVIVEGKVIGIDVTSSYFNVTIEKGDEFCVLLEDTYEPGTEVVIEDGILKIKGDYCDSLDVCGFDVSPASKLLNPFAGNVTIKVPENDYMQLVYADIGCGSFKMKDMSCARLVAQVGIGGICLDDVDVAYERFLECKLGTVYANGDMNLAINHADSSSDM